MHEVSHDASMRAFAEVALRSAFTNPSRFHKFRDVRERSADRLPPFSFEGKFLPVDHGIFASMHRVLRLNSRSTGSARCAAEEVLEGFFSQRCIMHGMKEEEASREIPLERCSHYV
jgi:hypothetical protein